METDLHAAFKMGQWLGMFAPQNRWLQILYRGYQAVIVVVVSMVTTFMTIQLFVAPDLTMLARTIDLWTMCLTGLYKWCIVATFSKSFLELMSDAAIVRQHSEVTNGALAYRFTSRHQRNMDIITKLYVFSGLPVVVLLSFGPIMTYQEGDKSDLEYFNDPRSYPLCCWLPFTVFNYLTFSILCILQILTTLYSLLTYLINDAFMFGALFMMGGQLQLLSMSLANIIRPVEDETQSELSNNVMPFHKQKQNTNYLMLIECVKHHNLILNYIRKLRLIFNTLILVDFLHAIISLTFAIFQTMSSIDFGEGISMFAFIIISFYHQFLNHIFGEYIIQKQLTIRDAAYNVLWFRADKRTRQLLTIMICRANHPLIISGLYMYKLCYQSLITFLKTLYTFYMVLRRVTV